MIRTAVYTGTSNLYPHMITAVKSLIMNSDVDQVYLLIEDDKFPYELPDFVKTINVSDQTYFRPDGVNMDKHHFTYIAYMRGALTKVLPNIDKILSFDVDTIVDRDITDIWDLPIDDYYFAASKEPVLCLDGKLFTNMGVTLFNLRKIREDGIDDQVIEMVNTVKMNCPEQEAYNRLCQGHILEMPSEFNQTRFTLPSDNPKVIHFAGIRKWFDFPEVKAYERMPMEEVMKYHKDPSLRNTKQRETHETYMIHACPERMWYVREYLIPSMMEQGIESDQIIPWVDDLHQGNLESFMQSLKWLGENKCFLNGTWHLQDDVVISKNFHEITEKETKGIVCGFCNEVHDGGNVNLIGIVPSFFIWLSMPCIRIPNLYAKQCADWFYGDVLPNGKYAEFVSEGKHDDVLWRKFLEEKYPNEFVYNYIPNLVDHVDYLIGGSTVNKQRDDIRKAYRWEEPEIVEALKEKLKNDHCRTKRKSRSKQ